MERINKELQDEDLVSLLSEDPIGRNAEIANLLTFIDSIEGGYSVFLNASWGDGKSVFVRQATMVLEALNENLDSREGVQEAIDASQYLGDLRLDEPYLPIYYNAWQNDALGDPLPTIIATIATEADLPYGTTEAPLAGDIAVGVLDTALKFAHIDLSIADLRETFSGKDYLDSFKEKKALRGNVSQLIEAALPGRGNKLVLFIDELDRCSPAFALRLLEEVKFLFENDRVILVFSTDVSQLVHVVSGMYGQDFDSWKYLERFYDRIIPLEKPSPERYLGGLGLPIDNGYFNPMIHEIANHFSFSLRATNIYVAGLSRAKEFSGGRNGDMRRWTWLNEFFISGIIPLLHAYRLEDQERFNDIVLSLDPSPIIDFMNDSRALTIMYGQTIGDINNARQQDSQYPTEGTELISDLCVVAFSRDRSSAAFREAIDRSGDYNDQIMRLARDTL